MRDLFQLAETQEPACAFDRVNGTKHSRQGFLVLRILLQTNQVSLQPVHIFVTFNQEIFDDVAVAHRYGSFPNWEYFRRREGFALLLASLRPLSRLFPG